jgi:hypothetical protein
VVKFFPVFFKQHVELSPIEVNAIYVAQVPESGRTLTSIYCRR